MKMSTFFFQVGEPETYDNKFAVLTGTWPRTLASFKRKMTCLQFVTQDEKQLVVKFLFLFTLWEAAT